MFGDLDWPINASRRFVSISWASWSVCSEDIICYNERSNCSPLALTHAVSWWRKLKSWADTNLGGRKTKTAVQKSNALKRWMATEMQWNKNRGSLSSPLLLLLLLLLYLYRWRRLLRSLLDRRTWSFHPCSDMSPQGYSCRSSSRIRRYLYTTCGRLLEL